VKSPLEIDASAVKNNSTAEADEVTSRPVNPHLTVDGVSRGGRKSLRIIFHVLIAAYCFWMLAIICDEYFIVSIEVLCQSQ
jgi:hypothetical protein